MQSNFETLHKSREIDKILKEHNNSHRKKNTKTIFENLGKKTLFITQKLLTTVNWNRPIACVHMPCEEN